MLHQTIIGLEVKKQLEKLGEKKVDVVIGCAGGGSNFAGLSFPFFCDRINGAQVDIISVEPAACPTMTRAPFVYDHEDTAKKAPIAPMQSPGHGFMPLGCYEAVEFIKKSLQPFGQLVPAANQFFLLLPASR